MKSAPRPRHKFPAPLPQDNHFLRALPLEVQERIYPHMQLVSLELFDVVFEANSPMRYVYFPTNAIISVQYQMLNGDSTAIMVVGNDGLLGLNVCLGGDSTPNRSLVQSAGWAYRIPRKIVIDEFARHRELHELMLRYNAVPHHASKSDASVQSETYDRPAALPLAAAFAGSPAGLLHYHDPGVHRPHARCPSRVRHLRSAQVKRFGVNHLSARFDKCTGPACPRKAELRVLRRGQDGKRRHAQVPATLPDDVDGRIRS